jgi:hypothetical protein
MYLLAGSLLLTGTLALTGCKKDKDSDTTNSTSTSSSTVPDVYKKIYGATDIYMDGNYVVIKCNGVPDHKSPYFQGTSWSSTKYEAYNGSNSSWSQNPNVIGSQSYVFKIPVSPAKASSSQATPLGPIGVSLNGVPFYNQYAGPSQPLTSEINSFDQYLGHPDQGSRYHYHEIPSYLTTQKGNSAFLGFLLDGYPVYGPEENGVTLTSSDLDAYHGHTGTTTEFPNGIYHYHTTGDAPYINGSGFYGTPGTVSN